MWRLRNSDDKVLTIAMEVRFTDVNYFNRVFKRIVGQTPTAYRTLVPSPLVREG
jgi:AraC-like DNA-binding protein